MKSPFVWGKGGRAMTPEDVERERELVALARAKIGDTSPVGHWTQGATRVVDALGAVLREKRTNKAEAAGLAGADERIAAILAGQGGGGGYTASTAGQGAPGVVAPGPVVDPAEALGNDAMAALGKVDPTLELIKGFEGFRETPYWDVNALRTGYGSDTITTADGRVIPVTKDTRVSREDADRDLQRRAQTEFAPLAASAVGAETFAALDPNQKAALTSIAYNYGELPSSVAAAVRSGDSQQAAAAIAALGSHNGGINAGRRSKEAEVYLGASVPGGTATYDTAGGAPAIPGGSGGMDIASLLALQSDPWVAKKYGGVVDALMGQQFSRQNALWEQQQKMADPMYQAQLAEFTAPKVSDYDARAAAAAQYGLQPGTPEYQRFVLAGDVAVAGGANLPAGVQELQWRAEQAGLVPGTPEYQSFIINGGGDPATYRALEMQAINAGLVKGTPEFQQFMATRGAGQAAYAGQAGENAANIETGGAAAGAVAAGKVQGEAAANAAIAAPADIAVADRTLGYIDEVRNHPGKAQGTGMSSYGNWIPGTSGKDFQNRVDQLKSGAFLSAIDEMRGMGSLSNAEGQTATAAITRMDTATSEEEFNAALDDYESIVKIGKDRAAKRLKAPEDAASPDAVPKAGLQTGTDGWTVLPNGVKVRVKP